MRAVSDATAAAAVQAGLEMLSDICADGRYATGAQLAVSVDGSATVCATVGLQVGDRPLNHDHLFNVWCASKPIPAIVLMGLLENAGLPLATRVSEIDTAFGNVMEASVGSVLNHSCGLQHPDLVTTNLMSFDDALSQARNQQDTAIAPAFSEFTASVIVVDLIEALSEKTTPTANEDFLETHALNADITFRVSDEVLERPLEHLGFYITGLPVLARPLYSDALAGMAQQNREIMGAYLNARGLAEFYRLTGMVLNGTRLAGFPTTEYLTDAIYNHRRVRGYDKTLHKTCSFAAGFMIELTDHGYGPAISPNAIGHTGLVGSPFGCYDPDRKLAFAAILNGMTVVPEDCDHWRSDLVNTICKAVDG